ncbi:hypothetical protein Scel_69800 [Streptomyces cellostaticus]|nr:hypothetical protein Scel_69800 [Streptomyces cellostaticus]
MPPRTWMTVPAAAFLTADSSWAVVDTVTVVVAAWAPPFDRPKQTPPAPAATATAAAIERVRVLRWRPVLCGTGRSFPRRLGCTPVAAMAEAGCRTRAKSTETFGRPRRPHTD